MDKLQWCREQIKGIKIIEPKVNFSSAYMVRAIDDLENIQKQNPTWKAIISYYVCYNALYAVLLRYGIKCEIHSCSIYLMRFFENLKEYFQFMQKLKDNRINTQYYLKEPESVDINEIKKFVLLCKLEIEKFNSRKTNLIHDLIKK